MSFPGNCRRNSSLTNGCGAALSSVFRCLLVWSFLLVHARGACFIKPDENGSVIWDVESNGTWIKEAAFKDCLNLKSITIPKGVISIGKEAFSGCLSLKTVTFPPAKSSLKNIYGKAFRGCVNLESLHLPDNLERIDSHAFTRCHFLKSARLPDSLKINSRQDNIFAEDWGLETVNWPRSLTMVPMFMFLGTSLKPMNLPDVSKIDVGAFYASKLPSILINTPGGGDLDILENAFGANVHLKNITMNVTGKVELKDSIIDGSENAKLYFRKDVKEIRRWGFVKNDSNDIWFERYNCSTATRNCNCAKGYGDLLADKDPTWFSCTPCLPGETSNGTSRLCQNCTAGRYTEAHGTTECSPCPKGKFYNITGLHTLKGCKNCNPGRYAPATGSVSCEECPPGSKCEKPGLAMYESCPSGKYQRHKGQTSCDLCPKGTYQNDEGVAFCKPCLPGKASDTEGSNENATCKACAPGKYSPSNSSTICTICPRGQYQDQEGSDKCKECGVREIGNANRTACIINKDLLSGDPDESKSLTELLFGDSVAWMILSVNALIFIGVAGTMTYFREADADRLSNYSRLEAVYYSLVPGFNFGSSLVLLAACLSDGFVSTFTFLVLVRLMHIIGGGIILMLLFSSESSSLTESWLWAMVRQRFKDLSATMDEEFPQNNIYIVESVAFLSLMDVNMLSFMPWKKEVSHFFRVSEGFPVYPLMVYCLVLNTASTIVTVACELVYLATSSPSGGAESLFIINIIFGVISCFMSALILGLRGHILKNISRGDTNKNKNKSKSKDEEQSNPVIEMSEKDIATTNGEEAEAEAAPHGVSGGAGVGVGGGDEGWTRKQPHRGSGVFTLDAMYPSADGITDNKIRFINNPILDGKGEGEGEGDDQGREIDL